MFGSVSDLMGGVSYGSGTGSFVPPTISKCELYINNIFINPEIHDIYIHRIGFQLIRVFRSHISTANQSKDRILLHNLKWPIESLYFCLQPIENLEGSHRLDRWHQCRSVIEKTIKTPVIVDIGGSDTLVSQQILYDTFADTMNSITLTVHGIPIYNEMPSKFFNSYIPTHYGQQMSVSEDPGIHVIHFNLFPGQYQPSGHINISRAREFYLQYTSNVINSNTVGNLIVIAVAINFLIINDGSAILRYIT